MATWIFQGNPDIFDIDEYLRQSTGEIRWLVRQFEAEIQPGDDVFLWRSKGKQNSGVSGIIAKAIVLSYPEILTDDEASSFYKVKLNNNLPEARVKLRLLSIANQKEIIQRGWLLEDSALSDLSILKQAAGTNFRVNEKESNRLNTLWINSGRPWSEYESEEALKLYSELFNQPVSKTAGSRVEQLAQQIGRAPTGVYNKLMNFRALDPRVEQKGLSSGSKVDATVWNKCFNTLERKLYFTSLAPTVQQPYFSENPPPLDNDKVEEESKRLETKPLDELIKKFKQSKPSHKPKRTYATSEVVSRDPLVIAITRLRANYKCEIKDCEAVSFITKSGKPYIEVHHLHQLADGGLDTIENTAALCAQHHREAHYGNYASDLITELKALREKESNQNLGN